MLDFSIGVDIEQVLRFSEKNYNQNKNFYKKIFSKEEIKYCLCKKNPYPHFTARFCAKEAVFKALNDQNIGFVDIEIDMKDNKPTLKLSNGKKGLVSLSHTNEYAIAFVIIETL